MATKKGSKKVRKNRRATTNRPPAGALVLGGAVAMLLILAAMGFLPTGSAGGAQASLSGPQASGSESAPGSDSDANLAAQQDLSGLSEHPGPTTGEAKIAFGLDVQRLETEPSAFVWRGLPYSADARCPQGYLCTFHLASGKIMVVLGDGSVYSILAGTFRWINGYPATDAVHRPCEVVAKEQAFGQQEDPSFKVETNLSCG